MNAKMFYEKKLGDLSKQKGTPTFHSLGSTRHFGPAAAG